MRKLAFLVVLFAACGDDENVRHIGDAAVMDSPPQMDAPFAAAVKLTITREGTPQAGIRVYFQNPDSSLVLSTTTDASGIATAMMPNGGYVTAINPFVMPMGGRSGEVRTFAGVKPGDELVLRESSSTFTQVTVNLPVDSDVTVTDYLVTSPCGNTTVTGDQTTLAATLYLDDCAVATDFVVASLDTTGAVVNFYYAPNTPVTTTIDLTTGTYQAATTKNYTYTNVPTAVTSIAVDQQLLSPRGEVASIETTAIGAGTLTGLQKVPAFTNAVDTVVGTFDSAVASHAVVDWGPFAATYSADLSGRLLPDMATAPVFDNTNHRLTWTETAGGQTPDFVLLVTSAYRQTTTLSWTWQVSAPYAAGMVQFPTLPVEAAGDDFNFTDSDTPQVFLMLLGKIPGGYDSIRAKLQGEIGPGDLVTTPTGSITLENYFPFGKPRLPGRPRREVGPITQLRRRM